ncbi:MarC family protein [Acinetobacter ursingii]|uniref:MarC family protein n=1 Tax=Acinetobacter ursingii TaxID=108980 RepID=UPI003008C5F8
MLTPYIHSFALFFSLLNPFLMSIYMVGMIRNSEAKVFNRALIQGCVIAFVVFMLFAWGGETIFSKYLNVRFEAFQIFGGLIFLVIGYRYVFQGADTIGEMRGAPEHLAGTIAMPFMIGPGTISAAVVTGIGLPIGGAALIIAFTLAITCSLLILMKFAHDHLRYKHAKYIDRYVDIVGRLSALLIGTIAIDMIITGIVGVIRDIPITG